MSTVKETLSDAESRMQKSIENVRHEFAAIRTGKASAGLLDGIKVEAYGQAMPLKQVGNVGTLDSRTLTVQVWDKGMVATVEKAIRDSNLGLNPATDGQTIRIPVPPLTEERRKEYVKVTKKQAEEGKVAVRNIRRDANHAIDKLEKEKLITEDEKARAKKDIDNLTHKYEKSLDELTSKKEKEIMEV
ncbi:ribosome recycling factor [Chloroherpeton thalassium ATCC 35110]|uniref:Ribosome-recycling factor n=1 Tax=Chloroherpeton thalassium (strain ATCC 35110 / GB-78) TaxID=517418 RepID=B3QS58_CHLT3|nr:ribosome recycling factor [Chloroherpeton thalassium]ACF14003.1 ribosome recycling factor [Chloroherpeton thalassium ATCC 35110]